MKEVTYVQLGTVGLSMILPVGEKGTLVTTDPKTKQRRKIRYCPNEGSPFVDEQSEFATVGSLKLIRGKMNLHPERDAPAIAFLDVSPHNAANGGKVFKRQDAEEEAVTGLQVEDLITELKYLAKKTAEDKTGFWKLQALASVIEGSYTRVKDKSASELRKIVNSAIDNAPRQFENEKGEPELFREDILRSFMALKAIDTEVVKVSPDGRTILRGKKKVLDIPAGRKSREYFAEWLGTDDGMLFAQDIEKHL
jgi:hypothetical protein